jgi:hypothetical protein
MASNEEAEGYVNMLWQKVEKLYSKQMDGKEMQRIVPSHPGRVHE